MHGTPLPHMGDVRLSLLALNEKANTPAHLSRTPMDELQLERRKYDLLLWQAGRIRIMRVQQPDRNHALDLARRLNPGRPVVWVAVDDLDGQTE
jgi:hypothetical protein